MPITMSLQDYFVESHYWYNGRERPYCGVFGHSFIRRLCVRWNERTLYNDLPFSGEAHGTGGLSVLALQKKLRQSDLSKFDVCFIQIGENNIKNDDAEKKKKKTKEPLNNHELMYALIEIVSEFYRQGVPRVICGNLFQRHSSSYNKHCKRFNKMVPKIHPDLLWDHGPSLINNEVIDPWDGTHLYRHQEPAFAASIRDALYYLLDQ